MRRQRRLRGRARRGLVLLGVALGISLGAASGRALASPLVDVFPVPNDNVAQPHTQIVFRGEPITRIGAITVRGSVTGLHAGKIRADSDGLGGSFIPSKPFRPGETVTVTTSLNILGAPSGVYHFHVAVPAGIIFGKQGHQAPRKPGDVLSFASAPNLHPTHIYITHNSPSAPPGDIFLAPQHGPVQSGPMIITSTGRLVWFRPMPAGEVAEDFRTQRYDGQPVLTYWQGETGEGVGVGKNIILNSRYQQIAEVKAGNGLRADLHEFQLTSQGTAWITAIFPVRDNATSVHGSKNQDVFDGVVQEIDVRTGLVLFQWDSIDHVPLSASYIAPNTDHPAPYDYFHVNSIDLDSDGTIVVSARNTWAAYKIDPVTSQTLWTLGGKETSFKMGPGAPFSFQHDVRVGNDDKRVTMFDDGGGPPRPETQSRGLALRLDSSAHTATVIRSYRHTNPLLATDAEGNLQVRPQGDALIGWGQQPYFSEYGGAGQLLLDGHFDAFNSSYRVYRFPWTGQPQTAPAIAVTRPSGHTVVRVSWNGATTVARWRLLGGSQAGQLRALRSEPDDGFETPIEITGQPAGVQVQALSATGKVLGTSRIVGHVKAAATPKPKPEPKPKPKPQPTTPTPTTTTPAPAPYRIAGS